MISEDGKHGPAGGLRAIVFDVGRVLIDFSYDELFPYLQERGASFQDTREFLEMSELMAYEHGRISSRRFISNISRMLTVKASDEELIARWNGIFTPVGEMLELAGSLKPRFGVYLLSNTGELHWQVLLDRYKLGDYAHGAMASFEVGAMKPDAKIYESACQRFSLAPATTLFIDDNAKNVEGAQACGWQGWHHTSVGSTKAALARMGVHA